MTRHILLACVTLSAMPVALATHTAHACSCVAPKPEMLSPSRSVKAPLNARVRVALPTYLTGRLALRKHHGSEINTKRIDSGLQSVTHVELVPTQPLEADMRYEVAFIHPENHPSTLVFGTFMTGNAADTVAPLASKITKTVVNGHRSSMMTSCAVDTPWVEVFLSSAQDPDRSDAMLLHAVWASNARGVIDLNGPPTAYIVEQKGKLKLGKTSYCDPGEFLLPRRGNVTLAIAAVDEAGNRSAVQRVNLVMSNPPEANP